MENRQGKESEKGRYIQRAGMHVGGVLRATLACGMGVQILFGLAWLAKNMGGLQNFQESSLLLAGERAADGFYSGILYRWLAALLASKLWVLYGIQLAAAFAACHGLTACFVGRDKKVLRLFCALALVTIPQAMQCHLAVLPWSLGTSLLMGETALWRRIWERPKEKLAAAMLAGWLVTLLVLPIYAWFSLPMVFAALGRLGKGRSSGGRLACLMAALALLLGSVTVNCGWNPAHWNRRLAADALSRTGWPYFQYSYDGIPQPLHDEMGLVTAREVSAYADGVERVLIPRLEEIYGAEETTLLLWELTGICLRDYWKADLKNVVWDMAAYHATPPILAMQLKGRAYESYSGVNYENMKNRDPFLTRSYVAYGGRWWWVMLALAALALACGKLAGNGPDAHKELPGGLSGKRAGRGPKWKTFGSRVGVLLRFWLPVLAGMEWMILNFVLSGSGIMDYKKTLGVTILWYVAALWPLAGREGSREWQS